MKIKQASALPETLAIQLREVGVRISRLRIARRVLQSEAAIRAGVSRSRLSFWRSRPNSRWRSWYSASTCGSGSTMNTPWVPSTMTISFSRTSCRAWCSATMQGMFRLRATIAVCDVEPPRSVTKLANWCCLNSTTSAGDRSCATSTRFSSESPAGGGT